MQVFRDAVESRDLDALVALFTDDDREVEGCDFIHVNGDRLIDELYVMVRPLSGLMAMAEAMKRQLCLDHSDEQAERQAAAHWSE
jgi:hypothetical protein